MDKVRDVRRSDVLRISNWSCEHHVQAMFVAVRRQFNILHLQPPASMLEFHGITIDTVSGQSARILCFRNKEDYYGQD